MPDLQFGVVDAEVLPFAAGPTLLFKLRVNNTVEGEQIQSVMLRCQVRIETSHRQYDAKTERRLLDLFGERERWGETLRSVLWTHVTATVPPFSGNTVAELPVPCTYDFEVVGAKYLAALEDGDVPLLFLFSGTIFYTRDGEPLQIAQIPWEREASYRMPIAVWKDMMERYFPRSAWIRMRRDVFDRLYAYKSERALPTWEAAIEDLLQSRQMELER